MHRFLQIPRPILKNPKNWPKKLIYENRLSNLCKKRQKKCVCLHNGGNQTRHPEYVWRDLMEGNFRGNIHAFSKDLGTFLCSIYKNQMLQKKFQKEDFKFYCEKCNYFGKRKSQYERHLQTNKHKNNECYKKATEKVQLNPIF